MQLSAIIIAKDEEKDIARAIRSVQFADEVLVIDAESTDKTREVAEQAGARVIINPWPGYGAQKNFGREQARGEWLLYIDADEEVSADLAAALVRTIKNPQQDFYWLRLITVFLGKPLLHLYGHNPRLFRKSAGKWTDAKVHEQVISVVSSKQQAVGNEDVVKLGDNKSTVLTEPLWHYSHATVKSYLEKMHRYTTLDAEQMFRTGKHRSGTVVEPAALLPWYLAAKQFSKMYFYKKGFLDGSAGLIWCVLSAYYEWEMGYKYRWIVKSKKKNEK